MHNISVQYKINKRNLKFSTEPQFYLHKHGHLASFLKVFRGD